VADLQGIISYPGIKQVVSGSFSLGQGTVPSVCTLEILPQDNFQALDGDLVFTWGRKSIKFHSCRVSLHSIQHDLQGRAVQVSILDRRWKWAFGGPKGPMRGRWNLRNDDGTLKTDTERDPRKLIEDCMKALGETGFDIVIPDNEKDSRPSAEWECKEPAVALQELCDTLQLRICLRTNNRIGVYPLGYGLDLQTKEDVEEAGVSIQPSQVPDSLRVVCGPTRYEVLFLLQAIGKEWSGATSGPGRWKKLKDLSYAPNANADDGGFSTVDLPHFKKLDPNNAHSEKRELARKYIFRTYWIRVDVDIAGKAGGVPIPEYGKIDDVYEVLPIEDEQVKTYTDQGGVERNLPAVVWGVWWPGNGKFDNAAASFQGNVPAGTRYDREFTIDRDKGIVHFQEYVVKATASGTGYIFEPADLGLLCAVTIRPKDAKYNRSFVRHERELKIPGAKWNTGPRLLHHDEIQLGYRYARKVADGSLVLGSRFDNSKDVNAEADYYIQAALSEYQLKTPQDVTYRVWKDISPDGAIQQVTWILDGRGMTTRASRHSEHSAVTASYKDRQIAVKVRERIEAAERARRLQRAAAAAKRLRDQDLIRRGIMAP
jgi:hypothetical protein